MNQKKLLGRFAGLLAMIGLVILNACQDHRMVPDLNLLPDVNIYVLTDANQLWRVSVRTPSVPSNFVPITFPMGGPQGERILSIDFRPATGQLYGVSNMKRLFIINPTSGVARPLTETPFTSSDIGTIMGLDFNPTVDRIRLVTNTGIDLRLNPETGMIAATDTPINGVPGAAISEVAYTNNRAGATTTTLYDIDPATDRLYIQNPPNNGTLVDVGPLGLDITGATGFDIAPTGEGLVAVTFNGKSELQQINLSTGRLQKLGDLQNNVIGLAIPTEPVAYALDGSNNLLIFNPQSATAITSKTLSGLQPGETLLGIDTRPVNGQLYALGSSNRLYTITVAASTTWSVTTVGNPGLFTLSGTDFGFDFNPTVDRIRVVSNTGQNLRLDPTNGSLAATDGALAFSPPGGAPNVSAAAYTNNFAGATSTVLYDIDVRPGGAILFQQNPPNNGTLVSVGPLGVEVESANGFDIGGTSGTAYALLRVGGTTRVYTINLATGAATAGTTLSGNPTVRGFTLGLGF